MSAVADIEAELRSLEGGWLDPAAFPHREHVRFAFEMLRRHSFAEAAVRFAHGLRLLATKAGHPEIYHETITIAFLALIGERLERDRDVSWPDFLARNADLADKSILERWYTPGELRSEVARRTFCLPPPAR